MKRTSLTTAVIAGIAGVAGISNMASAVYLNQDGLGQVLIYPYYTVNNGNDTIITVVNTTSQGKAIKVRFLEAYDSREVLDFNLYMSPFDVWTATVVPVGAGAGVFTQDNSCTVPKLPTTAATAYAFSTYAFDGTVTANDGGPKTLSRTLEGYVELIEMGTVTDATKGTLDAITHSSGVPANCSQVVKAWSGGGYWNTAPGTDIAPPSGGLFGDGLLVNVALGTAAGFAADAIDQFYLPTDPFTHHTAPSSLAPSISSATATTSYVFAPGPTGTTPTLVTTTYAAGIDAVSSIFMADAIYNEYWTGGGTSANSEWVVTFPTKRFYVDPTLTTVPLQPFDNLFTSASGGTSCAPIGITFFDREEGTSTTGVSFSPQPVFGNALCYEAQVVTFNQSNVAGPGTTPSEILGSNLTANIETGFNNGWATLDLFGQSTAVHFLPTSYTIGSNNVFEGLPVTGFWMAQAINGDVGGDLANYTALYRHKIHRFCTAAGATCS